VIRTLVRTGIMLVANAIGLIVAAIVLGGVEINVTGFLLALLIFTVSVAALTPLITSQLERRNSAALGGVALIATLLSLIITVIVSDGLEVHGLGGWLGGTVIIWGAALLAAFLLPYFGLKQYLETRDDRR
jgi:Na+/melibiose symporter-like transporter